MMKELFNCYVGIPLPEDLKDDFGWLIKETKSYIPGITTVNPNTPHITVYYLGTQLAQDIGEIAYRVKTEVDILQGIELETCGLNIFQAHKPRILFIDLKYSQPLQDFYSAIGIKLNKYNKIDERPYVPHITLARMRNETTRRNFKKEFLLMNKETSIKKWKFDINKIVVYGRYTKNKYETQSTLHEIYVND